MEEKLIGGALILGLFSLASQCFLFGCIYTKINILIS